jgi:hypothetical protein
MAAITFPLEQVFERFRENGFPVYTLNRDEKRKELRLLLEYDHTRLIRDGVEGSEDFVPEPESLSLCATSPPYYRAEAYSQEATQSYLKFPSKEAWLHGFMKQTLANCHIGLKPEGRLVVNIAGVKSYPTLQDDFVTMAEANGWRLEQTLQLCLSMMPGTRKGGNKFKTEPIYVFRKS